jgi:mitochondrial fission protein ELM1
MASIPPAHIWVLTDGKAGDENQCLGVAEAVVAQAGGGAISIRRVAPGKPWVWLMPRGPIDPKDGPDRPESPIAPPYPDLVIASGRRAIPYLRAVRKASPASFSVILKDPRTGPGSADLIWVPAHDRLRGGNVLVTVTSPHRVSRAKLAQAATDPAFAMLAALPRLRATLLIGGDSRHHRFKPEDIARFADQLAQLAASGVSLMGSRSRRTPAALAETIAAIIARHGGWWWDGTGPNPYFALLAQADAIIATADSVNMIGEAAMTGKPILVFEPSGGHGKIQRYLEALKAVKAVHHFAGRLEGDTYPPIDSTQEIAAAILAGFAARQH